MTLGHHPHRPASIRGILSRTGTRIGLSLIVAAGLGVSGGVAQQPDEAAGLTGLLPAESPEGLTDILGALPENWQGFAEAAAADLAKLYGSTPADVAGQRAALAAVKAKLKTVDKALANPRYRAIHKELQGLSGGLSRRIALYEAVLATLELNPETAKQAAVAKSAATLKWTVADVEAYLGSVKNGKAWLSYLRTADLKGSPDVATLEAVHAKLQAKGDGAIETFLARPRVAALERAVAAHLAASQREVAPAAAADLRTALQKLLQSVEAYEAQGLSGQAEEVRTAYRDVRKLAADGGALLTEVLQTNYFYYNLHVVANEGFVTRAIGERRTEQGGVRDFILGADVHGSQVTNTTTGIDFLPSNKGARFNLTLNGHVQSNTAGYTSQATIYTYGNHTFLATKEVSFDGQQFQTYPGAISVNANNTTTGASTRVSGLPLLGPLADNRAMSEAGARRGQSEAIARERVSSRVLPQFNTEVDKSFKNANGEFQKNVIAPLKEEGLYPDAYSYRSTSDALVVSTRLMSSGELGGSKPPTAPAAGLVVQLHESLINNSLDRMNIAGRTMTEDDLRAELESHFSKLAGRKVELPKPEKKADENPQAPKQFEFASEDPIRVRIVNGELFITFRAAFLREDDKIPQQVVTVPLSFEVSGKNLLIKRGDVSVSAVEKPANVTEQIATAGIIRGKFEGLLPNRTVERTVKVKRANKGTVTMTVQGVQPVDGWLTLLFN